MLPITRRNNIKELVLEKKSVLVSDLSKQFQVTEETIRRDIKRLEQEGILTRTYGGAFVNKGVTSDLDVNIRQEFAVHNKNKLADVCVDLVNHGDCIFLDSSTTSLYIAKKLLNKRITIITNSLKIANLVGDTNNITLFMIGGFYNLKNMAFVGKSALQGLQNYFVDIAFISCNSVSMENGLSDSNEQQAEIRSLAIQRSNKTYLVADFSKFDKTSFVTIAPLQQIDMIIVDEPLSAEWNAFLEERGIKLMVTPM